VPKSRPLARLAYLAPEPWVPRTPSDLAYVCRSGPVLAFTNGPLAGIGKVHTEVF